MSWRAASATAAAACMPLPTHCLAAAHRCASLPPSSLPTRSKNAALYACYALIISFAVAVALGTLISCPGLVTVSLGLLLTMLLLTWAAGEAGRGGGGIVWALLRGGALEGEWVLCGVALTSCAVLLRALPTPCRSGGLHARPQSRQRRVRFACCAVHRLLRCSRRCRRTAGGPVAWRRLPPSPRPGADHLALPRLGAGVR